MTGKRTYSAFLLVLLRVAFAVVSIDGGPSGGQTDQPAGAAARLRKSPGNGGPWPASGGAPRLRNGWWLPRRVGNRATRWTGSGEGGGSGSDINSTASVVALDNSDASPTPQANSRLDGWTEWSAWDETGPCSTTCNEGLITVFRRRSCTQEYLGCPGDDSETVIRPCNNFPCLLYGTWEEWSPWTTTGCSVTCSIGVKVMIRRRVCDPSTATIIDLGCIGPSTATYTQNCKVAVPCGIIQPEVLPGNGTTEQPVVHSTPLFAIIVATLVGVPLAISLLCSVGALAHAVCVPEARQHIRLLARCGKEDEFARTTQCRCGSRRHSRTPPPCCATAMTQLSRPAKPTWDTL